MVASLHAATMSCDSDLDTCYRSLFPMIQCSVGIPQHLQGAARMKAIQVRRVDEPKDEPDKAAVVPRSWRAGLKPRIGENTTIFSLYRINPDITRH